MRRDQCALQPQPVQTGGIQIDEMWHGSWRSHQRVNGRIVQLGAGVTMVPGSFVGMKIDGLCFRPLHTDDPVSCVAAAVRESDLSGVAAQLLRAARAVVSS